MKKYAYYYEELPMSYISKVEKALEARIKDSSAELTLTNGVELLVGRKPNGDIQVYDNEPNLIAEFDNDSGYALFNASVFIIRLSRRDPVQIGD